MAYNEKARTNKRNIGGPCAFEYWDEAARCARDRYPDVRCEYNCESCGFNPEVKARRLEKIRNGK